MDKNNNSNNKTNFSNKINNTTLSTKTNQYSSFFPNLSSIFDGFIGFFKPDDNSSKQKNFKEQYCN